MVNKKDNKSVRVAVIGGSGVYEIEGMKVTRTFYPATPFGKPSDPITIGEYKGQPCAFLSRHGKGHRFLPGEIPQRANFYALKMLGIEHVIAITACGSYKDDYAPREIVVPDQIVDMTRGRPSTFFGNGLVAHVSFAEPIAKNLAQLLAATARELKIPIHEKGTYLCMEGPQFSTRAESLFFKKSGFDVVGMTAMPEAKLAREAEMSYALLALITDYDSWKEGEAVSLQWLYDNLAVNVENAKKIVAAVLPKIKSLPNEYANALEGAIFTNLKVIPSAAKKKLRPLISKYVK